MLTTYLIISLIVLVVSLIGLHSKQSGIGGVLFIALAFVLGSFWVLSSYIFSRDKSFYTNATHHALEQIGYQFVDTVGLTLANENTPENAIYDEEQGFLQIKRAGEKDFQLEFGQLSRPLLVSDAGRWEQMQLANAHLYPEVSANDEMLIDLGATRQLSLSFAQRDSVIDRKKRTFYDFKIKFRDNQANYSQIVTKRELQRGYPILSLIKEGSEIDLNEQDEETLAHALFIREVVMNKPDKDRPLSALRFFAGQNLTAKVSTITLNGSQVTLDRSRTTVTTPSGAYFRLGLGKNKGPLYKVSRVGTSNLARLEFVLTPKYPLIYADSLKKAELLLATLTSKIIESGDEYDGVIRFEGNSGLPNIHHMHSSLIYSIDAGNVQMKVNMIDHNAKQIERKENIPRNEPILLNTRSPHVSHIIQLTNFNENQLVKQFWWIYFILILGISITCVFIRTNVFGLKYIDASQQLQVFKTELIIYWIITVFLTVRLYLLWRLYAFPPLENVNLVEWEDLRDMGSFSVTLVGLVALFVLRFLALLFWEPVTEWIDEVIISRIGDRIAIAVIYLLSLLVVLVAKYLVVQAFVVAKLTIPFFVFLFGNWWIHRRWEELDYRNILAHTGNALFFVFFYFLLDKGFMMVAVSFVAIFYLLFLFVKNFYIQKRPLYVFALGAVAVFFLYFSHTGIALAENTRFYREAYRGAIITENDPGKLLERVAFEEDKSEKILWASVSHWFNKNFLNQRYGSSDPWDYPIIYNKYPTRGTSILVQTREVAILRFLIFEHNIWVPILLIGHLILLFGYFWRYHFPGYYDDERRIYQLAIILLMLTLATVMFLVCINQSVFIGQDFPFLSLTGKAPPVMFYGFFLALFLLLKPGENEQSPFEYHKINEIRYWLPHFALVFFFVVIFSWKIGSVLTIEKKGDLTFNPVQPVQKLKAYVDHLNEFFQVKQKDYLGQANKTTLRYSDLNDLLDFTFGESAKEKLETIEESLDNFLLITKDSSGSTYVASAFSSFFSANNKKNLSHILHLRKKDFRNEFEFVVNKNYYVIQPFFEELGYHKRWKGDLLAMSTPDVYYLSSIGSTPDASGVSGGYKLKANSDRFQQVNSSDPRISRSFARDRRLLPALSIFQVPGSWTFSNKNHVVARIRNVGGSVELANRTNLLSEGTTGTTQDFIIESGDVLQVGDGVPLTLDYHEDNFLAKRYNYNGYDRYFYPLGKSMIWAYNVTQMLKNNFDDQPDQIDRRTTIDFELQQRFYERSISGELFDDYYVTALDGDGAIRLLYDYDEQNADRRLNPNDYKKLGTIRDEIYFNTINEQLVLGNRCLLRSNKGFGSTIKPIIYGAVTSQLSMDWGQLAVANAVTYEVNRYGEPFVKNFGDAQLETEWTESYGEFKPASINYEEYLIKSRNMYNVMVTYIGSHDRKFFDTPGFMNVLFQPDRSSVKERFPRITFRNQPKVLQEDFRKHLAPSDQVSILKAGLSDNFGFSITKTKNLQELVSQFNNKEDNVIYDKMGIVFDSAVTNYDPNYRWVFSKKPKLIYSYPRENIYRNIINLAKGGDPLSLSQVSVARNAIRLFKMDQGVELTILEEPDTATVVRQSSYSVDDAWANGANNKEIVYRRFSRENIIKNLAEALNSGTSAPLKRLLNDSIDGQQYYFYAKTGTFDFNRRRDENDKALMVIVSKDDWRSINSDSKVFSIMITVPNLKDSNWDKFAEIINDITASHAFYSYMHSSS